MNLERFSREELEGMYIELAYKFTKLERELFLLKKKQKEEKGE